VIDLGNGAQLISAAVACIALVLSLLNLRSQAGRETRARLDRHEARIASLETDLRHMPDLKSMQRLEVGLTELRGEMRAMAEALKPVAKISDRLQEFLLENAAK
jgi:hypothetical protein